MNDPIIPGESNASGSQPSAPWKSALPLGLVLGLATIWSPACSDDATDGGGGGNGGGPAGLCEVAGQTCPLLCDPNVGCVECFVDGDCGLANPACIFGECEECGTDLDCPQGEVCFPHNHQCDVPCETDGDCPGDAPTCDAGGVCVECLSETDCPTDQPLCSPVTQQCVECTNDSHCGIAQPVCDIEDGDCEECLVDTHCDAGFVCIDHECRTDPTPDCDPGFSACGGDCVDLSSDPDHCGNCDTGCGDGVCVAGNCECGGTAVECDGQCVELLTDPDHCGDCLNQCDGDEFCDVGDCACRPGLTFVDGNCVDLASDPDNCGAPGAPCADLCLNGDCVTDCGGLDECDGACVDRDSDPLHCGECFNTCDSDEVCVEGECRDWIAAADGCDSCDGDFSQCCEYPGDGLQICVDADGCP